MRKQVLIRTLSVVVTLFAAIAAQAQYSNAVVSLNPVGYWPLNESGFIPRVYYIATNIGTLGAAANGYYETYYAANGNTFWSRQSNAISHVAGATGDGDKAMATGISGQYVAFPRCTNGVLNTALLIKAPFSIEIWAFSSNATSSSGLAGLVSEGRAPTQGGPPGYGNTSAGFFLGQNNANFVFDLYNTNGTAAQPELVVGATTNVWTYLVATFDGTNETLYANGSIAAQLTLTSTNAAGQFYVPDLVSPLTIGCGPNLNGNNFPGRVDEVAIYTNALSPGQVQAHFNAAASTYRQTVTNDNPIIYLRLGEPAYITSDPGAQQTVFNRGSANISSANGLCRYGTTLGLPGPPYAGFGSLTNAVAINGFNSAVEIGAGSLPAVFNPTGNSSKLTVIAWFKGNPADGQGRFQNILGHSDSSWRLGFDGRPHFNSGAGGELTATSYIYNDGNWHMVAGVFAGTPSIGTNLLYLDGVLNASNTVSNPNIPGSSADIMLGGDPQYMGQGGRFFDGSIAHVAFFTNALTAVQIGDLYNAAGVLPSITVQPGPATSTNNAGSAYINTVLAGGSTPLSYQWHHGNPGSGTALTDGLRITGSGSTNLTINLLQTSDSGNYYAVVTNNYGAATSSVSSLTVVSAPIINSQSAYTNLVLFAGNNHYTFFVNANGDIPLYYYWRTNGVAFAVTTNLGTISVTNLLSGVTYNCLVSNAIGTAAGSNTVPTIIPAPTAPYPVTVLNDHPVAYWRLSEGPDAYPNSGTSAYDHVGGYNGVYSNVNLAQPGYTPANSQTNTDPNQTSVLFGAGTIPPTPLLNSFVAGVPFSFAATNGASQPFSVETWVYGGFTAQSSDAGIVTVGYGGGGEQFALDCGAAGHAFRFYVHNASGAQGTAGSTFVPIDGAWHHVVGVCDQPNGNVYLYVDGVQAASGGLPAGTGILTNTAPLAIGSREAGNTPGTYTNQFSGNIDDVAVYDKALSAAQVANHYYSAGIPPQITLQPLSTLPGNTTNAAQGLTVTIPSAASGSPTLLYQWYDYNGGNSLPLNGQTNANLVLANVNNGNIGSGLLYLDVTNAYGFADSLVAQIFIVTGPPSIISDLPPVSFVLAGSTATLPVGTSGNFPQTNRWQAYGTNLVDGGRISGSHSNILTIANSQLSDSGNYQLWITNSLGTTNSSMTALIVEKEPLFNTNGAGWTLNGGATVAANVLTLTDGATGEARSFFYNTPVYIHAFRASFTYTDVGGGGADGMTFCLQNTAAGTSALGAGGGGMAYRGITNSAAIAFNIYNGHTIGYCYSTNGTLADGNVPAGFIAPTPVALASGDPINVSLSYDGNTLTLTVKDANNSNTYTTAINVGQLWNTVGGDTAYIGFTGGTGGVASTQRVSNFSFAPIPALSVQATSSNTVVVSWPAGIGGYVLQQATNVTGTWQTVAGPYPVANGRNQINVPTGSGNQFYRLILQ